MQLELFDMSMNSLVYVARYKNLTTARLLRELQVKGQGSRPVPPHDEPPINTKSSVQ
jgi:hypothetical protein